MCIFVTYIITKKLSSNKPEEKYIIVFTKITTVLNIDNNNNVSANQHIRMISE